ncbi:SpoIVB peptidase [Velocimicrobium porci]|uniref:SpoIVB peptidase n=1 Tax=Velocimicrobium porci TaxID=2606634 RepID=A0A6L5XY19_9FIRM|nr:SpoIVB peptidase [Velocimicrobium porci]MSS63766.1 SpoIVB peptidase [Velocimicrobium porci]
MKRLKIYRRLLIGFLILDIAAIAVYYYIDIGNKIPNHLTLFVNQTGEFDYNLPVDGMVEDENISVFHTDTKIEADKIHFDFSKPCSFQVKEQGNYKIALKLFGIIQLKEMNLHVVDKMKAMPVGRPIGIYIATDGVMVLGTGAIQGVDGLNYEPALNLIKSGDYITEVDGKNVSTIEELTQEVQRAKGDHIVLKIIREGEKQQISVTPVRGMDGVLRLGIWTRDDTQGIGTLTYIDDNLNFGALGHGITDTDTGVIMNIASGEIYKADVLDIVKGKTGEPGELVGLIHGSKQEKLGTIKKNSKQGIFGIIEQKPSNLYYKEPIEVGLKQDIQLGNAKILCQVEDKAKLYDIEIEKIQVNSGNQNKGMVIRITDPELLKITNGIVQGMSGSPIIQNNKLVGAVTHVFVKDSTKGYGTFIENMLNTSSKS